MIWIASGGAACLLLLFVKEYILKHGNTDHAPRLLKEGTRYYIQAGKIWAHRQKGRV